MPGSFVCPSLYKDFFPRGFPAKEAQRSCIRSEPMWNLKPHTACVCCGHKTLPPFGPNGAHDDAHWFKGCLRWKYLLSLFEPAIHPSSACSNFTKGLAGLPVGRQIVHGTHPALCAVAIGTETVFQSREGISRGTGELSKART